MYEIRNSGSESEKPATPLLSQHETGGLLQIPRALRLIEDHDVLNWWTGIDQRVIAEVVNVLDERFDAFANFPFPHLLALFLSTCDFITRQRFAKHGD